MALDLRPIRERSDAYRDAFAQVLRTGEPDSDGSRVSKVNDAMIAAAMEAASDVEALVNEVTRLRIELEHNAIELGALAARARRALA